MFKTLAAGLVAAALLAVPVMGGLFATPADAAVTAKTKIVKVKRHGAAAVITHPHRAHNVRHAHVRVVKFRHGHVVVRKHPRHVVKTVKRINQVKQTTGRAG